MKNAHAPPLTFVKRIAPVGEMPGPMDIYISNALMDELTADAPIKQLDLFTTIEYASALESALRGKLPTTYLFSNSGSKDAAGAALEAGHPWLLSCR